jgi:hypothetical protein
MSTLTVPVRQRLLNHVNRQIKIASGNTPADDPLDEDPPLPLPGQIRLHSYYLPALEAGDYSIKSNQHIKVTDSDGILREKDVSNKADQNFTVIAPRFSIEKGKEIHSSYPPQGYGDQARTLPHVVLNDPHLPWERENTAPIPAPVAGATPATLPPVADDSSRNAVPWIALLVFSPNELVLTTNQLATTSTLFPASLIPVDPNDATKKVPLKQTTTMTVPMTVDQYAQLNCPIPFDKTDKHLVGNQEQMEAVFVQKSLLTSLITTPADRSKPDISRYKYMSHVRNVNTLGMADAGVQDQGLFSIVVSHRTGPTLIDGQPLKKPTTQIVHLVSIENLWSPDFLSSLTSKQSTDVIGLISLYSWTYQCLPPDSVNFVDTMRNIGTHSQNFLRVSDETLLQLAPSSKLGSSKIGQMMMNRLKLGYTLVRYRTPSGEETVAFQRGPMVPVPVRFPITDAWPANSNTSQNYQILDKDLGIMDISYASAWQLGKTLAVADRKFSTALMKFRTIVHDAAAKKARMDAAGRVHPTINAVLGRIPETVNTLIAASSNGPLNANASSRWSHPNGAPGPPVLNSPEMGPAISAHVASGIKLHTGATSTGDGGQTVVEDVYTEFNTSTNPDWPIIFSWIIDRLSLAGIPRHYLITEPAHLPPETIRFFYIDSNWTDALIDGALSVANHLSRTDDAVRNEIKNCINTYLRENLHPLLGHPPQVPSYGFFLRSAVVQAFPDIKVEAPFIKPQDATTPADEKRIDVLHLENIDKDIMMCLLDRTPDSLELGSIVISQPAHQQCFSLGDELTDKDVQFTFRKTMTRKLALGEVVHWDPLEATAEVWTKDGKTYPEGNSTDPALKNKYKDPIYDWNDRIILFPTFAKTVLAYIQEKMPLPKDDGTLPKKVPDFQDDTPSSGLIGIQLNDPIYFLEMDPPKNAPAIPNIIRQLHTSTAVVPPEENRPGPPIAPQPLNPVPPPPTDPPLPTSPPLPIPPPAPTHTTPTGPKLTPTQLAKRQTLTNAIIDPLMGAQFFFDMYLSQVARDPATPQTRSITTKPFPVNSSPDSPLATDIIFALNLNVFSKLIPKLRLYMVEVTIPVGPSTTTRGCLMDSWTGTGARMLSNQRWVVRVDNEGPQTVCRIIPRSTNFTFPLAANRNVSFRLNQVVLSPFQGKGGLSDSVKWPLRRRIGIW